MSSSTNHESNNHTVKKANLQRYRVIQVTHANNCEMWCLQVDKLVETKGLDYMDREKAKRHAKQQAEQMYDQQYGGRDIQGGGGGNWGNLGNQYGVGGEHSHFICIEVSDLGNLWLPTSGCLHARGLFCPLEHWV